MDKLPGKVLQYTGVAIMLPVSTVVGYFMGYGLDLVFHTHFLYIVFLILGTVGGLIQVIRELS